jgi:hypothetical protein
MVGGEVSGYQVPFPMRGERPVEKEKSACSEGIQAYEIEAWRGGIRFLARLS